MSAIAFFLSALLGWQTPQQPGVGVVQGTVTRVGTTEGLAGVQVDLLPGNYQSVPVGVIVRPVDGPFATSDSTGRFEMRNVPAGRYSVRIQSNGYSGSPTNSTLVAVTAGGTVELNLSAIPGAILRGRVIDGNGQFLSNVNVQAFLIFYRNGLPHLDPAASKMTDDRGEFRLFGIAPGEYYVAVSPRPPLANTTLGTGTVRNVRTFYPASSNAANAIKLTLKGGEEITNLDIQMQSALHVRVSGRVINPLAPPAPVTEVPGVFAAIANAQMNSSTINLLPRDVSIPGEFARSASATVLLNASTGEFVIPNVTPGAYDVFGTVYGQQGAARGRVAINVADRDVTGIDLAMRLGSDVSGSVTIDGVSSLPILMNLQPVDSSAQLGGAYAVQREAPGMPPGVFAFRSVQEGRYRLLVSAASGQYVEDILQNGRSIYDSGVDVSSSSPDPIQIVLKSGGGTVEGRVVDASNKPLGAATVALVPMTRRVNPGLYRSGSTDATGSFSLRGIPPGEYKLFAWPLPINGAFYNAGYLEQYEESGRPVTVELNSRVSVTIGPASGR